MKKTVIASVAFATALFAVSCQKETNPAQNVSGPMTISAVSEGLNTPTKTELAFKYDVLWSGTDKIYVKDASGNNDTFKLKNGAGTTKGTFTQEGQVSFTGEAQAYYPATMLDGGSPVWPASQTNDQTIPMYCKKTLSGAAEERMDFASLGSVLQIVFNTTQENVTLKSIEIKDGSATLSGAFSVDADGKANITATDKAGITLDLGTGVALGKAANYFNIAVPAGNYQDLTLVFTATDGTKCTMTGGKVNISYNTVGRLTLMGEKFKADVPAGALSGEFSVSDTKKVYFSKGNLWADGDNALHFEANQYSSASSWDASHVSHFNWSSTVEAAVGNNNSGDNLFCDESHKVSVDGGEAIYYALSKDEWTYLFNNHSNKWASVNGLKGYVIAPDGFEGDLANSYANDAELVTAGNLVFLPAAGHRGGSTVNGVGVWSYYWSSTAYDESTAYDVYFDSDCVYPDDLDGSRERGFSVRLITEASVTPAPTPTTKGTAKATIGGSEVDVNWVQLWENGPKFAEYNVGASSATDFGTEMTFTDATKAGADYIWGANWCTPSKVQMDELLKAATDAGSEKVECEYTQEGSQYGFKFTGLTVGYTDNSVFFPANGESNFQGRESYWSASADEDAKAWLMFLSHGAGGWTSKWNSFPQFLEYFVRPVLKN